MRATLAVLALVLIAGILMVPAVGLYFESGKGARCTSCHEMDGVYARWTASSHRDVNCGKCHGDALTTDTSFHLTNIHRAVQHVKGDITEQIALDSKHVNDMNGPCRNCHRQEFASWQSGPHSADFKRIFLDAKHNKATLLMDDCLRCHGMYFEGGVRELVVPVDRQGPWRLVQEELSSQPTMPCLGCHMVHRRGEPMRKGDPEGRVAGPKQEIARPSLAFYDRRTGTQIPVAELPIPTMLEGTRPVRMSKDQRQALCYQCHAPTAAMQVGSGDDRTGLGVHEGISCLACHAQHGQKTRASCASCHPKMSNCGLDVEKMDTTFRSPESKHNIHWVKCADCHTKGVPRKQVSRLELKP
jgi:hypothetical protein